MGNIPMIVSNANFWKIYHETTVHSKTMNYRAEIDGLRAIAVLSVIFFHAGFSAFSGGFVGVDIFFVISGFLITSIIQHDIKLGEFSFIRFYERRGRRILPALFFVMLCCIPFAWIILLPYDLKDFFESIFAIPVLLVNHLFLNEAGYFAAPAENKPLLHTWSLAVEEQYYLIFPLILFLSARSKIKSLSECLLLIFFMISLILAMWYTKHKPDTAFYTLPTRAWEFLAGALIPFLKIDKFNFLSGKIAANILSIFGISMLFLSIFGFDKNTLFPAPSALIPVIGTVFIIMFANDRTWVGRLLTYPVLVKLGLISYSAYLWHQPIFAFYRYRFGNDPSASIYLFLIAFVLLLSFFSWKYIENFFRSDHRISKKRFAWLTMGVGTIFICIGLFGHSADPMKLATVRFDEDTLKIVRSVAHSPYRDQCHFHQNQASLNKTPCTYFSSNASVAVFGNSHAVELAYALAEELKSFNAGVVHHTISGCTHNYKIQEERTTVCGQWHENVYQQIVNDKSIKTVVLSYRNEIALSEEKYRKSLAHLANDLADSGKKVILVLQAPMPVMHVNHHLSSAMPDLSGSIPSRKRADWNSMYAASADMMKLLSNDIKILDPQSLFCDVNDCYVTKNGIALFFDDDHISVAGAKLIVNQFIHMIHVP